MTAAIPAVGLHRDVPRDVYESWRALNHSKLHLYAGTPAHAHYVLSHGGRKPTAAFEFGTRVHTAVLEPEDFARHYVKLPAGTERRTSAGKRAYASFIARAAGRVVVDTDEYDLVLACAATLRGSAMCRELLDAPGAAEISAVWEDPATGEPCKGRFDRIVAAHGWTFVVDVKTARSADPSSFSREVADFGYHEQAAFYLDGCAAIAPGERRFVWLVVEKEPPHCVALYEPTSRTLAEGRARYRRHLELHLKCEQAGAWPGYLDGIEPLHLPRWAQTEASGPEE